MMGNKVKLQFLDQDKFSNKLNTIGAADISLSEVRANGKLEKLAGKTSRVINATVNILKAGKIMG
jgi:hypothetical protein